MPILATPMLTGVICRAGLTIGLSFVTGSALIIALVLTTGVGGTRIATGVGAGYVGLGTGATLIGLLLGIVAGGGDVLIDGVN